jgi:phage portal protein BeeE
MKLFGFEITRRREAGSQKSITAGALSWMRGGDLDTGGSVLSNAYQQVAWVYRAVNVLAEQVANVPFLFSTGERGRENLISRGPLVDFYARPHPHINRFQYWELRIIWLMLRGECFRIPIFEDPRTGSLGLCSGAKGGWRSARPVLKAVLLLDPTHFQHLVENHHLVGWRYTGMGTRAPLASQVFLPEEVWFEKLPNPFDFWRGLAPLSAAAMAAGTDFAAGAFMRGIIENNADTGVIVRADKPLGPEQQEQLFAALRDRKRKAGRADQPLLVTGCAEVIKPQLSSSDLQFLENRKFSRSEICAAFGVPEEILSATDHAKYDVMQGARLNFLENRVAPLCGRLEAEEVKTVAAIDPAAVGWFDLDSLPLMQQVRRERLTAARVGFEMGVPFNELNRVLDLGFKALPWGERGYVPGKLKEVGAESPNSKQSPESKDHSPKLRAIGDALEFFDALTPSSDISAPTLDSGRWTLDPAVRSRVKAKIGKLRRFLFEQRGRVLQALQQFDHLVAGPAPAAIETLLDLKVENDTLLSRMAPLLIEDACLRHGSGQEFVTPRPEEAPNAAASQWPPDAARNLCSVNERMLASLKGALSAALAQRECGRQLACRVRAIYNGEPIRFLERVALELTLAGLEPGKQQGGAHPPSEQTKENHG